MTKKRFENEINKIKTFIGLIEDRKHAFVNLNSLAERIARLEQETSSLKDVVKCNVCKRMIEKRDAIVEEIIAYRYKPREEHIINGNTITYSADSGSYLKKTYYCHKCKNEKQESQEEKKEETKKEKE